MYEYFEFPQNWQQMLYESELNFYEIEVKGLTQEKLIIDDPEMLRRFISAQEKCCHFIYDINLNKVDHKFFNYFKKSDLKDIRSNRNYLVFTSNCNENEKVYFEPVPNV